MALAAACGVLASSKCTIHTPAGEVCGCRYCALTVCVLVFVQFLLLSISVHQLGPPPAAVATVAPALGPPTDVVLMLCTYKAKATTSVGSQGQGQGHNNLCWFMAEAPHCFALLFAKRDFETPRPFHCFIGLCLWWPSCRNANTAQVASCEQPVCGVSLCVPCERGLGKQRFCDCVLVHGTVELAQ